MMEKEDLLKMAKHVFRRGQGMPDKRLIHPSRDWAIGILIFAAILFGGSYYSAITFSRYQDVDTTGGETGVHVPSYQGEQIETTISKYQAKEKQFNDLTAAAVNVPEVVEEVASTTTSTTIEFDVEDELLEASSTSSSSDEAPDIM